MPPFPLGRLIVAQGQVDKENPKKSPRQTNLKVIAQSNVVNLMEENGWLPCELMSGRVVALSGGTE